MLQLHKSNILPLLTYCNIVWHFCKSSDKKKMEGIQERALRAAFKLKSEIYSELNNRSMSTKSVESKRKKTGLGPTCITETFNIAPKRYNLRNAEFNISRSHTYSTLWKTFLTIFWAPSLEKIRPWWQRETLC